jgi:putative tryptophan/tyrosine transport system substrate-binding protein
MLILAMCVGFADQRGGDLLMIRRREFIAGVGAAAVWPLGARAQQQPLPVIGYLSAAGENSNQTRGAAFRQGLGRLGFVEGRNVEIFYRYVKTRYDHLPTLAEEFVQRGAAVIAAVGGVAAKSATATIPIVFVTGSDPVKVGLVASLNRPGGNVTGVSFLTTTLIAKRLDLLHEMTPAAAALGFLLNPTAPTVEAEVREGEAAARSLGVRLVILNASTASEIEAAFATLVAQRIGGLSISADSFFGIQRNQLATLAARHAVPTIYPIREYVNAGGLMSYGADLSDVYRLVGSYTGRILKGEKPADLPVQQSTKVELALNLKVAKALGITIPTSLLIRADEVIE